MRLRRELNFFTVGRLMALIVLTVELAWAVRRRGTPRRGERRSRGDVRDFPKTGAVMAGFVPAIHAVTCRSVCNQ